MGNKQEARPGTALMELVNLYNLLTEDEKLHQEEVEKMKQDLAVVCDFSDGEMKLMARLVNCWPTPLPLRNLGDGSEGDFDGADNFAANGLTSEGVTRFAYSATGEPYLVLTESTMMDLSQEMRYLAICPDDGIPCAASLSRYDYDIWPEEHDEDYYGYGHFSDDYCPPAIPPAVPVPNADFMVTPAKEGHFFEKVRDVDDDELFGTNWIVQFVKELESSRNSKFAKGWRKLGADKLESRDANAFCFALRQFIRNFTTPIAGTENKRDGMEVPKMYNEIVPQANMENLVRSGFLISYMSWRNAFWTRCAKSAGRDSSILRDSVKRNSAPASRPETAK